MRLRVRRRPWEARAYAPLSGLPGGVWVPGSLVRDPGQRQSGAFVAQTPALITSLHGRVRWGYLEVV
jgi:hypothetical protein